MAAKVHISASDAYRDDVLKAIKHTIKTKSAELSRNYEAAKTFARNNTTFVTEVENFDASWRDKFERRQKNLACGFFAERSKPYLTVGTVYLEDGDLVLQAITDDLKNQISFQPRETYNLTNRIVSRKTTEITQIRKSGAVKRSGRKEVGAGSSTMKEHIRDANEMRRLVKHNEPLEVYLKRQRMIRLMILMRSKSPKKEMKSPIEGGTPWNLVRQMGAMVGEFTNDSEDPASTEVVNKKAEKPVCGNDLLDLEDRKEELRRYREKLREEYLILKLETINSLLCAIINMKARLIRFQYPLTPKLLRELMRSDVSTDPETKKPCPSKQVNFAGGEDFPILDDGVGVRYPRDIAEKRLSGLVSTGSGTFTPPGRRRSSGRSIHTTTAKRVHTPAGTSRTPRTPSNVAMKLETWADLINLPTDKRIGRSTAASGSKYNSKTKRRDPGGEGSMTTTPAPPEGLTPATVTSSAPVWTQVQNMERIIKERKENNGESQQRSADDVLDDIRTSFAEMQHRLVAQLDSEVKKHKQDQSKVIRHKYMTLEFGPLRDVCMERMRQDAREMTRKRNESQMKPHKWFNDIKGDMKAQTSNRNDTINLLLSKLARFQYEDIKTMPLGKEKLCLLAMSTPAYTLLTRGVTDAFLFVVNNVLGAPKDLFHMWLASRKLISPFSPLSCVQK